MNADTEWSQERRELIELIQDIAYRLRNGAGSIEVITMLETAIQEAENLS